MGAFIISAIGNNFADSEGPLSLLSPIPAVFRRRILVIVYFSFIISVLTLFGDITLSLFAFLNDDKPGAVTIPDIVREGIDFVNRLQNENIWTVVLEKMRSGLGWGCTISLSSFICLYRDNIMEQFEKFVLLVSSDNIITSTDTITQVRIIAVRDLLY